MDKPKPGFLPKLISPMPPADVPPAGDEIECSDLPQKIKELLKMGWKVRNVHDHAFDSDGVSKRVIIVIGTLD